MLSAGTGQTLSVTFTPTDATDYTTATQTTTIDVNQVTPTISWPAPAAITYGTALGSTQLDASTSWTVGGILGSVAGTFAYAPVAGTVLSTGTGQTLAVIFTPTDTVDYTTATQTTTINVNQATPTISWPTPAAITYGTALGSTQLDARASWTVGETWAGVAGTYAYTPAAGTVLDASTQPQTLSVTFTPSDTTDYTTATQTTTINVNQAAPTITWAYPAEITYGTPLSSTQLNATANVPGSFAYSPALGTVLSGGNSQKLSVTFTPSDTTDYATTTAAAYINVLKAAPLLTWANPADITYGTPLSSTQLDATANVYGSLAYNPATGTVLSAGNGQTLSVIFTPSNTTDYATATQTATINVDQATPAISWPAPAAITYGTALGSTQLDASTSWTVGGTSGSVAGTFAYAPVAGTVLSTGTGQELSVTFTPTDTTDYTTATQTTTINVNQATPTITWATPAAITYGTALGSTQLDASASWTVGGTSGSVDGTFAYTPVAGTVLNAGTQPQTLSVTFTPTDTTDYATATQTTTIDVNRATPTITWATPAAITYGTALGSTQLDASASWTVGETSGSVAGTFAYTPAAGTVLNAGTQPQTLSVTFTPSDTTDYTTAVQTTTIDVNRATPAISWPAPAAITYGTALGSTQLDATANVLGSFAYSPATGTVLSAGNGQELSVTFTPTDTTDYTTATQSTTIDVNQATPAITWATPAAITYGAALGSTQLDASASWTVGGTSGSVGGTFAYNPATGTVLSAGNGQKLSVTFTPSDTTDYTTATLSTTIDVDQATPAISWPTPAAVTYGTVLGSTQLNASASWTVGETSGSVAGTFAYAPVAGTVLSTGTSQTLAVTFTPTDTTDYTTATQTTTINVNQATPMVTVTDAGGTYNGNPFPATATVAGVVPGVDTTPAASLENVSPTLTYYAGTNTSGTNLGGALPRPGTYTVVASFAGSADYKAANSASETFAIVDTTPPTVSAISAPNAKIGGGTSYTFTVTYSDKVAVNVSTLGNSNIVVTGPGGFSQDATLVSASSTTNATLVTATYRILPPGGIWSKTGNGTYTIAINAGQVTDTGGNPVAAGTLGTFTVNAVPDKIAPTAKLAAANVAAAAQGLRLIRSRSPTPTTWRSRSRRSTAPTSS